MGICKNCGEDLLIVNKFFGLCMSCNNERLHGSKYGKTYSQTSPKKTTIKRSPIKKIGKKTIESIKLDEDFYRQVFDLSDHKCEECGCQLNTEFRDDEGRVACRWRYSHILPKSTHPKLRHNILNVNNLCMECHQAWENGDKRSMKIFEKNEKRVAIMRNS